MTAMLAGLREAAEVRLWACRMRSGSMLAGIAQLGGSLLSLDLTGIGEVRRGLNVKTHTQGNPARERLLLLR